MRAEVVTNSVLKIRLSVCLMKWVEALRRCVVVTFVSGNSKGRKCVGSDRLERRKMNAQETSNSGSNVYGILTRSVT